LLSTAYKSKTRNQKNFRILDAATEWHEQMALCHMQCSHPLPTLINKWACEICHTRHSPRSSYYSFPILLRVMRLFPWAYGRLATCKNYAHCYRYRTYHRFLMLVCYNQWRVYISPKNCAQRQCSVVQLLLTPDLYCDTDKFS